MDPDKVHYYADQGIPPHSLFYQRQQSTHDTTLFEGQFSSWKFLHRHAMGKGKLQQQALRGEHLAVLLRQGMPKDGVHHKD